MPYKTKDLINLVSTYETPENVSLLKKACAFSEKAHHGQLRASGEAYFMHPVEVAMILAEMHLDATTIITAILHDTVEDTSITLVELEEKFSKEIASLVNGVTKLSKIHHQSESERQAENFRKLLVAMSKDIRVLIVKLADRLHNMKTLSHIQSESKRRNKALETMEIYAPLAERIGMQKIKNELQYLAFAELYPDVKESIVTRLNSLRENGDELINKIIKSLTDLLKKNNINAQVLGREKTPFSIWHKMKRKNINFEQLSDVMAFRIVVDNEIDCYRALGYIHSKFHAIPQTFKDYISTPKKNGYQSIHTVVIGPEEQKIEIQLRSMKMHLVAEFGMATHWSYKQCIDNLNKEEFGYGLKKASITKKKQDSLEYNWIKELLDILESSSTAEELLENTKLEMYYDQVFCFTPKGRVIALPRGATAIDFAYAVHSDIGNRCVCSKVNGSIVPLRTPLNNGDQVEIITGEKHTPLPSWEKFAVTGKALSEIKKAIRFAEKQEYIDLGRLIVAQLLEVNDLDENSEQITELAKNHHKKSNQDFLYAIGEGSIKYSEILKGKKHLREEVTPYETSKIKPINNAGENKIAIKGLIPGMAVHLANCCHPIPGDPIVGIVQTGKGITVHISDCETLQNYSTNPEQWIDIAWDKNDKKQTYIGTINAILLHQPGSLAKLASEAEKYGANISNFKINSRSEDFFEISLDLEIRGLNHLTNIIAGLRSQPCIHSVTRHIKS